MKFPKFPQLKFLKLKFPSWPSQLKLPKFFRKTDSSKTFYHAWKMFIGQIPRESRIIINSYQHFIVLGNAKSGKTELIRGLIEQSQDLYPFDTSYTSNPDIQFYLGPNQVIQEISFSALEDKSIYGRKKTIKLWKKLYAKRDPIIIIAYDCLATQNLRDLNRLAQLIAGKASLLSEIIKKPLKIRIALTHLDKVSGYLEFARFLKQENLTFEISLTSNFESNALEASLKAFFEDYVTLMLTASSNRDFTKMLSFSKEMPSHFLSIEEFLRAIVSRVSFVNSIDLDALSFTTNQESSTSFNAFQWVRLPSMEIFFRYPLLKHQIAASMILLFLASPLFYFFYSENKELNLSKTGLNQLKLHNIEKFEHEIIPTYVKTFEHRDNGILAYLRPSFFGEQLQYSSNRLAERMRTRYIEQEYRKAVLENEGDLKCLYFNAVFVATSNNDVGKFILEHSSKIANTLNLNENILKAYIHSCHQVNEAQNAMFDFPKANPFIPFTSFNPWIDFFTKIEELSDQQIYGQESFEDIVQQSITLKQAVERLSKDPLIHPVASMLEEEGGVDTTNQNVQVIRWIGENSSCLLNFFQFIQESATVPVEIENMNIAQFFAKIRQMSSIKDKQNQTYNFSSIGGRPRFFHSKLWIDLVVAHNVEKAIQKYIALNHNSGGEIFFRNTNEAQTPAQPLFYGHFPFFPTKVTIPGRYTQLEYENKVRSTAEKLAHWVENLSVNPEDKKRFTTFLVHEVIDYVKKYENHYDKYFEQCTIKNVSLKNLKETLKEIAQDSSSFLDFLKFIRHQTSAFSGPVINLKNINDLNHFDFLNHILTVNKDEAPYAQYQKLMRELAYELDRDILNVENEPSPLQSYLSNIAKVSSDILQNNSKSYSNKVTQCLIEMGVPEDYRSVFLKPIQQLYKLGVPDLKKCIEGSWSMKFEPSIDELFAKFPFNSEGTEIMSLEELEDKLNPQSNFYLTMKEVMSTCCKNIDGVWSQIESEDLKLNEGILAKLNLVQRITDLLWDKEGNRQPITLSIQPIPFNNDPQANPIVVLSYFVVGDQSIRNLNQTPSWQTLKIDWWKKINSCVGVELMSKYSSSKSYKCVQKINLDWSFFELLKEPHLEDGNVFTWNIKGEDDETYEVSFVFDKNPKTVLMSAR